MVPLYGGREKAERKGFTLVLTVDLELALSRDPAPAGAVVALAAEVAVELLADVLEQQLRGVDVAEALRPPVVVAKRELRRGGINLMSLSMLHW